MPVGDRNEYLPTRHGFDEFYKNLYHLNAEEEPEDPQYPRDKVLPNGKTFLEQFGPRGVLHGKATDRDDPTIDPRFGRVGKQTIEDTGPLTRERMRTVEKDLLARSLDFIDRSHDADKPFFLWHNLTRMHVFTHLSDEWKDKTGFGLYAGGMAEFDWVVGSYSRSSWTFVPAQTVVANFVATFKEYPPSQASGTFGPGQALEQLSSPAQGH